MVYNVNFSTLGNLSGNAMSYVLTAAKLTTRSKCPSKTCCQVYKIPGHSPGDESYLHLKNLKNLKFFCRVDYVLFNFYGRELDFFGIKHQSAEHAFQYIKTVRCGDFNSANSINQDVDDALSVFKLGKKISTIGQWESTKKTGYGGDPVK